MLNAKSRAYSRSAVSRRSPRNLRLRLVRPAVEVTGCTESWRVSKARRAVPVESAGQAHGNRLGLKNPLDFKNRVAMNLAKMSANGQITVPAEVRQLLHLMPGDKLSFLEKPNGEIVTTKAGLTALPEAQTAFSGSGE